MYYQQHHALRATMIQAVVPGYMVPLMYKKSPNGEALASPGSEYYDSR